MLNERKFYLNKEVFGAENITMVHVRLLVILTSYKGITLDKLTREQKLWVVRNASKYSTLPQINQDLINSGLLCDNGKGTSVKGNYITFDSLEEIKSIKNLRQLFILSINKWHKNSQVFITKEVFGKLFGTQLKRANENWNNTNSQLGTEYAWKEVNNSIIITVAKKEVVDTTVNPMLEMVNSIVDEVPFVEEKVEEEVKEVVEVVEVKSEFDKEQDRINAMKAFGLPTNDIKCKLNELVVVDGIEYEPYNKFDMIETERSFALRVANGATDNKRYLPI